jgi:hypothetical protein
MKKTEELFEVEKILDRREINGVCYYKVKWEGYPKKLATWEPVKNLRNVDWMINKYEKQLATENETKKNIKETESLVRSVNESISSKNNEDNDEEEQKGEEEDKNDTGGKNEEGSTEYAEYGLAKAPKIEKIKHKLQIKRKQPEATPSLTFDTPKRIVSVRKTAQGLEALIEWENRPDGQVLAASYHLALEMRKHKHLARALIEYYESIIIDR